jgi:hypothetical protein
MKRKEERKEAHESTTLLSDHLVASTLRIATVDNSLSDRKLPAVSKILSGQKLPPR